MTYKLKLEGEETRLGRRLASWADGAKTEEAAGLECSRNIRRS